MKKLLYLFLFSPFFFTACNNGGEVEKLKAERDSLEKLSSTKDETINDFIRSFNEVESNLETIKQKEKIISLKAHGDIELDETSKDKINDDILAIYELMKKNKETIARLEKRLKSSNIKAAEFQKMISRLQEEINSKDEQIESLKNDLTRLNIDIEKLNEDIAELNSDIDTLQQVADTQEETIEEQDQKLHTAFYVYGTKKELKEHKIITSEGGFIGIGRMQKLMENFNKDYFKTVDIRKLTSVPLFAKKAELITSHPASSYFFAGDGKIDSLVIKDQEQFWSVSKYMVVMVN
jgi:DNA repair exonuclease SbcCD ATPase subunit